MIAIRQEDVAAAKAAVEQALKLAPADKKASLETLQKQLAQLPPSTTPPANAPASPPAVAPVTPAPPAVAAELTGEAKRKLEVLNLIAADAGNAKSAAERRKFLDEYLAKSEEFLKANPNVVPVWTLRADDWKQRGDS